MSTGNINIADNFMGMINTMSREVRLDLITRIAASLKKSTKPEKDDSWKELFGAFESEQTADEIIEDLIASRYTNRQIETL
jgi:hypothetical protein